MRDLLQRVDTRVGATGAAHRDGLAGDEPDGCRERAFDAAPQRLDLPTDEVGPVVLESQCDSRHAACAPLKNATAATRAAALDGGSAATAGCVLRPALRESSGMPYALKTSIKPCASRR
jgi:hypothetical protein